MNAMSSRCQPTSAHAAPLGSHRGLRPARWTRSSGLPRLAASSSPKVVLLVAEQEAAAESTSQPVKTVPVVFQCFRRVAFGDHLRVVGSHELLGGWEVAAAPTLEWTEGDVWTATLQLPSGAQFEYKFVHIMPNSAPAWESTSNRTFEMSSGGPLAVTTQWNNPMAEYEARAITVQAPEALGLLETLEVGPAAPPQQRGSAAAELAAAAARPATEPHFQEGANYDADVESMFGSMATYSSLEDVTLALVAGPELAELSLQAAAAAAAPAVVPEVVPALEPAPAPTAVPGKVNGTAPASSSSAATAASLLKSVGKTAGFVAMGVAAGALMSAITVDVAEVAVMGAVLAAAGNAALAPGSSKKGGERSADGAEAADGVDGEGTEARRLRPKQSEPGVFVAAAVLSALDKVQDVLGSSDEAAQEAAAKEEEDK